MGDQVPIAIKTREMQKIEARNAGRSIDEILRELYIDRGLTLEQVGAELADEEGRALTKGAVSDWLARCGIATRRPGQRAAVAS